MTFAVRSFFHIAVSERDKETQQWKESKEMKACLIKK